MTMTEIEREYQAVRNESCDRVPHAEDDVLPLPVTNWADNAKKQPEDDGEPARRSPRDLFSDDDVLPLPPRLESLVGTDRQYAPLKMGGLPLSFGTSVPR